ncbi:putative protocadherin beta-18 [Gigantopelta aegis]|uniref:putative protocadherin beta-18 n=1 Tax=Gigantopelta aegis TaxID=1735272 RepID=UPI001B88D3B7|nr:putative protocadherin beta-18 [Gigantopelta aegis]
MDFRPAVSWNAQRILLLLVFNIALYHIVSSKQDDLVFRLVEEQPAGTFVGSVSNSSGIVHAVSGDVFRSLVYTFLNPNTLETASMFSINKRNGAVYTTSKIDRERICDLSLVCEKQFDVMVQSNVSSYLKILSVKVVIDDINDNQPIFQPSEVTKYVVESDILNRKLSIHSAHDMDTGAGNGVKTYRIMSHTNMFDTEVENKLDGSSDLKIVILKPLDREKQDKYTFKIEASDGGSPRRTGTLTVHVKVKDYNDNAPVFTQTEYNFSAAETLPLNSVIGQISASDVDMGRNAQTFYRYSSVRPSKLDELFSLDEYSGELRVMSPLQYESGQIYETVVEAVDRGVPPLTSQAKVFIRVLDVGNTPPKVNLVLKKTVYSDTILLSEGSPIDTFVGHVKVEDNDSGLNGIVSCTIYSTHFSLNELEGKGYAILVSRQLDREVIQQHNVTVVCYDSGSPSLKSSVSFLVIVTDINDNNPVFSRPVYYTRLAENAPVNQFIVKVSAQDDDLGVNGDISYRLNMDAGSMFTISSVTGIIKSNAVFDRETISEMKFIVKAVDHGTNPNTGTATVIVIIADRNDRVPEFVNKQQTIRVPELTPPGTNVGKLSATDEDKGRNAEMEFMLDNPGVDIPFVVFSNGVIKTNRVILIENATEYLLKVVVFDKGRPPLSSYGNVTIIITEVNKNSPVIVFPTHPTYSVRITTDAEVGSNLSRIVATDKDDGPNGKLTYGIADGNEGNLFGLDNSTGVLYIQRRITLEDEKRYKLTISVHDGGKPEREARTEVYIILEPAVIPKVLHTGAPGTAPGNGTAGASSELLPGAHNFMVIAGIVAGVTIVAIVIIVSVIVLIRRTDNRRRPVEMVKTGVQEEGDTPDEPHRVWVDVSPEDIKAGFGEKRVERNRRPPEKKLQFEPDSNASDSFLKKTDVNNFGKQEFLTFKMKQNPSPIDDVRSDTSGETTASDSGRGCSEDDIQLVQIPRMKGLKGTYHSYSTNVDPPPHVTQTSILTTFASPKMAEKQRSPCFRSIHTNPEAYSSGTLERDPCPPDFSDVGFDRNPAKDRHVTFVKTGLGVSGTDKDRFRPDAGDYTMLKS